MDELIRVSEERDYATIRRLLDTLNIVDVAEALGDMEKQMAVRVFRMLPKDKAADVFAYAAPDTQLDIVQAITDHEIKEIVEEMFLDDAVDFIEEMPASVVHRILAAVPEGKREMINTFLRYPEDSAGSVMTVEFIELKLGTTVRDAFIQIRNTGLDKETIYTCYVIDRARVLLGIVTVRALLLAGPGDLIDDIMDTGVISARTTDDQESLANSFRRYGLLAIPVVDGESRLVGIVTIDDALTVQEEEATEDFEIMAALSPSETPYLKTGVLKLAGNRIPWLLLLMLTATFTGMVISGFEHSLSILPVLVTFIPMLMDTGGNSGSQSAVLVIRGMALGEVKMSDLLSVWWKEVRVAALCGAVLATVNFARVLLFTRDAGAILALTISLALYATVLVAKTVGCLLPMAAKRLKLDPAVMSPVTTTVVDVVSLIIFFSLARVILRL
ncbi:MAG: magnesium transporter [Oscillospiraceae bacterium]|nr:magnesium transporter [Oscillospiraceae bacterium]